MPADNKYRKEEFKQDWLKLNIKLKQIDFFHNRKQNNKLTTNLKLPPSTWIPDKISPETENTLQMCNDIMTSESHKYSGNPDFFYLKIKHNLNKEEWSALNRLRKNTELIIKPADKGSMLVIMNRKDYETECLKQLNDLHYYKSLEEPLYLETAKDIQTIVDSLHKSGFINYKIKQFLSPAPKPRARLFYILPKIHKPINKWTLPNKIPPGRPIVSDCSSESYNLSIYIDSFLNPLVSLQPSFIKDSFDFIAKIRGQIIPSNALIVTADVNSLYTNMNVNRTISVVNQVFHKYPDPSRPNQLILKGLEVILKRNDFEFNNNVYLQTTGIAMGKRFAPSLANLYLAHLDNTISIGFEGNIPLFFFRYIDDIFFIWPGTREVLDRFFTRLNQTIPGIELIPEISGSKGIFLDTEIFKITQGNHTALSNTIHFKETNTFQFLHANSYHPKHIIKNLPKAQFIRVKRLTNSHLDYKRNCNIISRALEKRGYKKPALKHLQSWVWDTYQDHLERTKLITSNKVLPLIFKYNKFNNELLPQIKRTLQTNNKFKTYNIVKAYKKGRCIKDHLTKTKHW